MTQLMKQKLIVIFTLLALIFASAGFLLANDTLAWFAKNDSVSANGLSVNVKVSPTLIIGTSPEQLREQTLLSSVDFKGMGRSDMIAVTHNGDVPYTYLEYLKNTYAVDGQTGYADGEEELIFEPVPQEDNEVYFTDYTVYISSAFDTIEVSSLTARIVIPESVDDAHPYFYAASIDFYVDEVSADGYRGTTSVSDSVRYGTEYATDRAFIELMPGGGTVPINTDETKNHIKVIMRCYFDGALQDPITKNAYVNSYTAKADGVVIGVDFVATDKVVAE